MIRLILIINLFLIGCASNPTKIRGNCQHTESTFRCAEYVKNYDGDTLTFNIPNIHPLVGKNISVRIRGLDTPEIKGKTKCEKQKAIEAKKQVSEMLKKAKNIELRHIKRGKYFRIVADVIVNGKSIKDELIKLKLAYPYDGKTKKKINWCL